MGFMVGPGHASPGGQATENQRSQHGFFFLHLPSSLSREGKGALRVTLPWAQGSGCQEGVKQSRS